MATIKAFRRVCYNSSRVPDLAKVFSQPYDRVRYGLQDRYYDLSPYNVVRIIKGKEQASGPDVYAQARVYYERWLAEGVLSRDVSPALYVYHQTFAVNGQYQTRRAVIAALKLTSFDEGIVLPHEQTHSGPKQDRLRLLRALEVHTGQIFMLYPDPRNVVSAILDKAISRRAPDVDASEMYEEHVRQQLWVVQDPATIEAVGREMAPMRNLIIADGHHRYETALDYRDERLAAGADSEAACNYCMAALVSMDDSGLAILATHREVFGLAQVDVTGILGRARSLFDITPVADLGTCLAEMQVDEPAYAFGLYVEGEYYALTLKSLDRVAHWMPQDRALAWNSLDVSVAHKVLLEQVIGLSEQSIGEQTHLRYHRDPELAVENVNSGQGDLVVLLNPTRIEQVKACTELGVKMPPKSTDFYPKMISGLTMLPVSAGERL